jgi:hypothetical protein
MSLIKKIIPVLIIILIATVSWVGFSVYFQTIDINVDPNATSFTKPINSSFDTETLEQITEKTEESFPVSPDEFLRLNQVD